MGEKLTKETFDQCRQVGGVVIIHAMNPGRIKTGKAAPGTIIASDEKAYAKMARQRTAGTYSRVIGKYVREE